jgi:hypothetical protein
MSKRKQKQPSAEPPGPQGSVESMNEVDNGWELAIRLRNPLDRAIHFISDVRGMIFDPAARRFRVRLSDQGREMLPAGISMAPRFSVIDPHSDALIKLRLPKTVVKLADIPSPTGEVVFEEHAIADANEIALEIGWADTPYYSDTRDKSRQTSSVSSWEQQSLRIVFTHPPKQS